MWFIPTKKEIQKEFEKVTQGFNKRDLIIEKLKEEIKTNSLKIATLEGAYSILHNNKTLKSQSVSVSESQPVSVSLKKSQGVSGNFETRLLRKIKTNKKAMVMAEIMKLIDSYSVIEVYEKIVIEKGLCSKASFYRYIESLKSQSLLKTETIETKIETKKRK